MNNFLHNFAAANSLAAVFCLGFTLGVLVAGLLFSITIRRVHRAYRVSTEALSDAYCADTRGFTQHVREIEKVLATGDVEQISELQKAMATGDEAAVKAALRSRGSVG